MTGPHLVPLHDGVTLGILAGGQSSRLGGADKAWLRRGDGRALVLDLADHFGPQVDAVLVSANRNPERYLSHGLRVIHDRSSGIGPLAGLDALAAECRSEWLLTLPVDVLHLPEDLPGRMLAGQLPCFAVDADGQQPLVALWRSAELHAATGQAIEDNDLAVHALQRRLGMRGMDFANTCFGNLNTPADLIAAGITDFGD